MIFSYNYVLTIFTINLKYSMYVDLLIKFLPASYDYAKNKLLTER